MPEAGCSLATAWTVPMVTAAGDEDRVRGNVYALLGHLLSAPPEAGVLQSLTAINPAPSDPSLLTAAWQMLSAESCTAWLELWMRC